MTKAEKRTPRARLVAAGPDGSTIFTLSTSAIATLTQENARFVMVLMKEDGTLQLRPMTLPDNVVSIVRLHDHRKHYQRGPSRVAVQKGACTKYELFTAYKCQWNDVEECLEITQEKL